MKKQIIAWTLALVMCFALIGCTSPAAPAAEAPSTDAEQSADVEEPAEQAIVEDSGYVRQTEEGTLTVGVLDAVSGFDPVTDTNYLGEQIVYETLFYVNPDTQETVGILAESWEYRDDTHLYVKLYDNATFSNGETVTCEDVLWSWYRTIEAQGNEMQNILFIDFENTEIINDKEMVLAFNYAFAPALGFMSMPAWGSVLCKSAMENATADEFFSNPVGSGPYTVVENVSGSGTTYALRADYWNADTKPTAETIYVRNYTSSATMFIDFETGALDCAFDVDSTDAERVLAGEVADTSYKLLNDNDVTSIAFPEYTEAFQDIRVRKALAMAIDVNALTEIGWGNLAKVSDTNLPSTLKYSIATGVNKYDVEGAKALLEEAGIKEGDLKFKVVVVSEPIKDRVATTLQQQWAAIGVELEVLSVDLATAIPYYMAGDTDIIINQGGGVSSFDAYEVLQMSMETSSNATIRVTDADFNTECKRGMSSIDEAERADAYAKVQQWLADNYRMIPIAESKSCLVFRPYITDVVSAGGDSPNVRYVSFK